MSHVLMVETVGLIPHRVRGDVLQGVKEELEQVQSQNPSMPEPEVFSQVLGTRRGFRPGIGPQLPRVGSQPTQQVGSGFATSSQVEKLMRENAVLKRHLNHVTRFLQEVHPDRFQNPPSGPGETSGSQDRLEDDVEDEDET